MDADRRTLLRAGLALLGGAAVTACGGAPPYVSPTGEPVRAAERARAGGRITDVRLTAVAGRVDLGGPVVHTWSYDGRIPGVPVRVRAGEVIRARLANRLPAGTSVHWHGLALRNDADGVPGVTQPPIAAGGDFVYEFTAATPGTYWFHPHSGTQLDRGLYAPLIVEDPRERLRYDAEWTVVLDDWLDGVAGTPDDMLNRLRSGMHHGHMAMSTASALLGGDAGDVTYPHYLLNGRIAAAPETFRARPGRRVRIRLLNAGSDTAFRVALAGHRMTITHADGYPVQPVETDTLLIAMGERYDVLVTLADGVFPLVALAEGKNALARGLVRTGGGRAPELGLRPRELDGALVPAHALRPVQAVRLPRRDPGRTIRLELTGGMMAYDWAVNGRPYDPSVIEEVRSGERVRLAFANHTMMWHPMHLHGHTFALTGTGVRKDTAIVLPHATLEADFDADNPGVWMVHCHNAYHAEAGMMALLGYRRP
ncbi:multicopper oxidase family protein [Thermoactinospora rubra]|uniref:multicopper oxidase family protein n=1 Tax=Thermoactinospora rubra TaxID=1088767 RepID=UPI000A115575|nr:multicopper oxidase family protein [Thermoactinospora rubra]